MKQISHIRGFHLSLLAGQQRQHLIQQTMLPGPCRKADIAVLSGTAEHPLHTLPVINRRTHRDEDEIEGLLPAFVREINIFEGFAHQLDFRFSRADP
ncbi:hypothetical protein D3C81_1474940 [compost metagenome]